MFATTPQLQASQHQTMHLSCPNTSHANRASSSSIRRTQVPQLQCLRHPVVQQQSLWCSTALPTCSHSQIACSSRTRCRLGVVTAAAAVDAPPAVSPAAASGHTALLHGLGDVGDIPAAYMPWVLRIAAACSHTSGGDSQAAMADISRGISTWRASLNRGLLPDDEAIQQLQRNSESFTRGACTPGS